MKVLFFSLFVMASAFAQDPAAYLKNFDAKIYSLKTKGVKDFSVDIESSKLTKQMNDQQMFGKVEELIFRTYWTAEPERLAIEIIGLPDGFMEIKDELKVSIMQLMDNLLPQTSAQRFAGYKFTQSKPKEIIAQDTSGIAPIPSFTLKFDEQDKLVEVDGNKPIGTLIIKPVYEKTSFSDGKWVLNSQTTTSSENGQTLKVTKELDYGKHQGISVLSEVSVSSEHTGSGKNAKTSKNSETLEFKNYKLNEGVALKYFLAEGKAAPQKAPAKPVR
jgi:hypothetical protein